MTTEEIIKAVKAEIDYSETTQIKLNPYFAKTQPALLDLIDLYWMSKFKDGDTDSFGKKIFYNINNFSVDVAAKMLDIDTKDIQLRAEDDNYWTTWIMQKELEYWMKDKYFGNQINQFGFNLPKYGQLVVKKVGDDVQIVPLRNMRFRPDAVDFNLIPKVEKHIYQPDEFRDEAKKRGWDNWKDVRPLDTTGSPQDAKINVFESYFPEGLLDGKYNYHIISDDGHLLAFANTDDPYKSMVWEKIDGRTMGRGNVEKLFEEQIYLNRIANLKASGLEWTSLHLFQTRDQSVNRNLMGTQDNGDVLTPNSEITPISTEERNLGFYNYEEARMENNANKRTFTQEPITGGRAPSGTPLGSTILQAQMAGGFYKQKKEQLANFIKEILWDWVLPEFQKEMRKEHSVQINNLFDGSNNSEKFFKMNLDNRMNKLASKGYMTPQQREIRRSIQAEILKKSKLKIPKGVYDNLKYKLKIVITGEELDAQSKLTTLQTIFQILGSNPTVLQDPRIKKVFFKMLSMAGFNPMDIDDDQTPSIEEANQNVRGQVGGSIASPTIPNIPSMVPTATAV